MSGLLTTRLEEGLVTYLQDNFAGAGDALNGVELLPGHRSGAIEQPSHVVITAVNPGGPLAKLGIYSVEVQLLVITSLIREDETEDEELAAQLHRDLTQALVDIFADATMMEVVEALNAQGTGYGVSAFDSGERQDGKDKAIFATGIPLMFTAHLAEVAGGTLIDEAGGHVIDEFGGRLKATE